MGPIWGPAVPLRLQVRPLRLKVRLLVRLPYRWQDQVQKNPLLNNWVRTHPVSFKVHIRNRGTALQQLLREKQEFDAWRASRAQAKTQSQPQIFSEAEVNVEVNVDSSERSASMARARPQDQVTKEAKAKRAGSASTSRRSPSPKRDYPRGTSPVTRPSQASPRKAEHTVTPAQDLKAFKADMTSMLSNMLQASFQKFASQFNTNSGGQGNNSNEDTVPNTEIF